MIHIFIGENNSGKTHELHNKEKELKDKGYFTLFFSSSSEIMSLLNGEKNSNFEGNEGTQKKSYYENAISKIIIEIFSKKFNNKLKKMKEETFKCLKDYAHNFICGIKKTLKM